LSELTPLTWLLSAFGRCHGSLIRPLTIEDERVLRDFVRLIKLPVTTVSTKTETTASMQFKIHVRYGLLVGSLSLKR
jgi:hypothetical protein